MSKGLLFKRNSFSPVLSQIKYGVSSSALCLKYYHFLMIGSFKNENLKFVTLTYVIIFNLSHTDKIERKCKTGDTLT